MHETWLPVVGYEGLYEVSDQGQIRSLVPSKKRPVAGHVLKPKKSGQGYQCVGLYKDGKPTTHTIHRVVMRAFVGVCPDGMNVNHKDGKKRHNALSNLEYVTHSENAQHALATGLLVPVVGHGEKNPNASLTEAQATEVAVRLSQNERPCDIARAMGISENPVRDIKSQRKWGYLFAAGGPLEHLARERKKHPAAVAAPGSDCS